MDNCTSLPRRAAATNRTGCCKQPRQTEEPSSADCAPAGRRDSRSASAVSPSAEVAGRSFRGYPKRFNHDLPSPRCGRGEFSDSLSDGRKCQKAPRAREAARCDHPSTLFQTGEPAKKFPRPRFSGGAEPKNLGANRAAAACFPDKCQRYARIARTNPDGGQDAQPSIQQHVARPQRWKSCDRNPTNRPSARDARAWSPLEKAPTGRKIALRRPGRPSPTESRTFSHSARAEVSPNGAKYCRKSCPTLLHFSTHARCRTHLPVRTATRPRALFDPCFPARAKRRTHLPVRTVSRPLTLFDPRFHALAGTPSSFAGSHHYPAANAFSTFAQLSLSVTVRLKTGRCGVESRSTEK